MSERETHWQNVYRTKSPQSVSWYQPHAATSLALIREAAHDLGAGILDVGGGASMLADDLLAAGYRDLSVLDISAAALDVIRVRLDDRAGSVRFIVADLLNWRPERTWNLWHDRAVFHFLTAPADQDAYLARLALATRPGAGVILATFAPDGPEKCSGLPVARYDADTLAARLGEDYRLKRSLREEHRTPGGAVQRFAWAVFERR
jgi:trans-aconitate methyltransferase